MMIRCPENSGTDGMKKRLFPFLFVFCLLFAACGGKSRFSLTENGFALSDGKTGARYTVLSPAFEPARGGDKIGTYRDAADREVTLRAIPGLSESLWLADDEKNVYCACEALPDPAAWTLTAALFCEEDAISIERCRLAAGTDDMALSLLRSLYFEGADAVLPQTAASLVRRVKLVSEELPNVYYCFDYYRYDGAGAYFFERFSGRVVEISAENDALFGVI